MRGYELRGAASSSLTSDRCLPLLLSKTLASWLVACYLFHTDQLRVVIVDEGDLTSCAFQERSCGWRQPHLVYRRLLVCDRSFAHLVRVDDSRSLD